MAETSFGLTYEGPALAEGTMPVRDLAPALFALGELFTEASRTLYPEREPVALNIKATDTGSFYVQLVVESKKAWDEFIDVFNAPGTNALLNFAGTLIGAKGVLWLIKRTHGHEIVSKDAAPDPGDTTVTLTDNTTVVVSEAVVRLYEQNEIRRKARSVVAPLGREGINTIKFKPADPALEGTVIEEGDLPAYELPDDDSDVLLDTEQDMVLEIVSVTFTEGNKWGFSNGERRFNASVEDENFIDRVNAGEPFSKGDMLRCRVRIIQSRHNQSLHIERSVVRVVEHIRSVDNQLTLGGDDAT